MSIIEKCCMYEEKQNTITTSQNNNNNNNNNSSNNNNSNCGTNRAGLSSYVLKIQSTITFGSVASAI